MKETPQRTPPTLPPAFEVEITSGGRAYDASDAPSKPKERVLSPTRAAAKASARRRTLGLAIAGATLALGLVLWVWLSNPLALVPGDAVVRVNGEFIYERDIERELDLQRAFNDLNDKPDAELPSAASALEDLIRRKLPLQDARKAGVAVSDAEVNEGLANLLRGQDVTEEELSTVLARYNLTLDDTRASISEVLMTSKHREENVAKGATTDQEKRNLINDWDTQLAQNARIDRLKPAGSGPAPRVGAEAPDFTLRNLAGEEVALSSLRGRPVMLNFWATWCPPCRAEIPIIVKLYQDKHTGENFEVLGVATQPDRETIRAFADEFSMTFPLLPDGEGRITSLYHVLPIPTTFFIDKDGIIRDMKVGVVDRETMEKWLLVE